MRSTSASTIISQTRRVWRAAVVLGVLAAGATLAAQGGLPASAAFTSIVHQPATETSFTLDRSMLAATDGLFNGQDPESRRVIAGLNSISVHNYHYHDGAAYDLGAFAALDQQFRASGYQHLVNANAHG